MEKKTNELLTLAEAQELLTYISSIHPFIAWDSDTKRLKEIETININGPALQFNLEQWDKVR